MAMSNEDHKGLQTMGYICTWGETNRTPWNNGDVRKGHAYYKSDNLRSHAIHEQKRGS